MRKYTGIKWAKIMMLRQLEDAEFKQELLYRATENWADARELFRF